MEELTAKEIAETTAEAARKAYETDGSITPNIHVLHDDGTGAIIVPNPDRLGDHPPGAQAAIVLVTAGIMRPRFLVSVTEAWSKAFPQDTDPDEVYLPPGTLQRESETDPEVRTVAMVMVIDTKDYTSSHTVHSKVMGDPLNPEWDIFDFAGKPEGGLPDKIITAYEMAMKESIPAELMFSEDNLFEALGKMGLILVAMLSINKPEGNNDDGQME